MIHIQPLSYHWTLFVPLNVCCQRLLMHIIEIVRAIGQGSVNQINKFFIFTRFVRHFESRSRDEKRSINTKDNKAQINWCYETQSKSNPTQMEHEYDSMGKASMQNTIAHCTMCRQQLSHTHTHMRIQISASFWFLIIGKKSFVHRMNRMPATGNACYYVLLLLINICGCCCCFFLSPCCIKIIIENGRI